MIKINSCSKKFKEKLILDNQNIEIDSGIYKLDGKNGVGKSTVLKMLIGLDNDYIGDIINNYQPILYLTTEPIGIHPFTLMENLEILWNVFSIKPNNNELKKIQNFFDNNLNTSYSKCSTGMKAKLGLSLLLVKKWDLIIIDETISSLDSVSAEIVTSELIQQHLINKSTIIYVSHNQINQEIENESKTLKLEDGKIYVEK